MFYWVHVGQDTLTLTFTRIPHANPNPDRRCTSINNDYMQTLEGKQFLDKHAERLESTGK
jgi:hypothetical protein